MNPSIAIVGMACVYPDARNPAELWENALAQRRAFRRLPAERLRGADYWSAAANTPDATYTLEGAVIEGYEFDRVSFRVAGSTFRAADLAHWLALEVAARALADAGFAEGEGLPRESTGVLLGNTLTGEFSRANMLRLRWPYVRRVVEAALLKQGWSGEERGIFLGDLEVQFKAPFPPVGEETLAGGLSNTIAGRICNHFDLKGGGYTVDGACASSLLATANACAALTAGDLDVALAGGVDLSLDPFEIVGFAKTGALAPEEMRIYDRRSAGFWPGEGCGFVTLMRHEDALAQGRRVYAVIRGWGVSSDGSGGLTRPELGGQLEALRRAYRRAGFGADSVAYCEGHGTGTAVGDATELEALSGARREARAEPPSAAIGSIKANIGHTKAAAGIAGLIKATMAVHTQTLPPTTGCEDPHPLLGGPAPALRVLREPELWPADRSLRASVSAMGFGGINAHLVLEGVVAGRRGALSSRERVMARSHQDSELFLLAADSAETLAARLDALLELAPGLSRAELTDLAAQLQRTLTTGAVRAAIVAARPAEFAGQLQTLRNWLREGATSRLDFSAGIFLSNAETAPRLGFLFPGQGSPTHLQGGLWTHRFESARELYARVELPADGDPVSTAVTQPAVVTASLAGLGVLRDLGVVANAALGHSLGELTALHWAGAFDEATLLRIVRVRGASMAELGSPTGAMVAIAAPWQEVQELMDGDPLAVVGFNSPRQTVVAGEAKAVSRLAHLAADQGWSATALPVSHAFHTPLVAAAVPVFAEHLARETVARLERPVVSTVTGTHLERGADLRALLCRQVTSPVRFEHALACLLGGSEGNENRDVDLLIEVGPGSVLAGLVRESTDVPVVSLDAGGASVKGLLHAVGAVFALGAPVRHAALFADRFTRPFVLDRKPQFFVNPCELAPVPADDPRGSLRFEAPAAAGIPDQIAALTLSPSRNGLPPLEMIRQMVAERAELPVAAVQDASRMLRDLHLNSITVGQLVSEAAKSLGLPRVVGLTDFANASVEEISRALEELVRAGGTVPAVDEATAPSGVDTWVRVFSIRLVETKPRPRVTRRGTDKASAASAAPWQVFAPDSHPLAGRLRDALARADGGGVLVCLPPNPTEDHLALLLAAGQAALELKDSPRFVVVQHGWGGSGFARSLHLERTGIATCVINVPARHPRALEWIVAETAAVSGFLEVHYSADGQRLEPRLELTALDPVTEGALGPEDVLLVTGGGKGIAAECALALARESGVRLALLGRSSAHADPELAANLARMAAAGARCIYVRADVTDAAAVRAAVAEAERKLGPVTAVLHGAGLNTPQLIGGLDEDAFRRTVLPKVQGARNVLAAVDAERLRLFVAFGSIIARGGLAGEADYATANEWLTALTEAFHATHPRCRCLALEWSVWSGAGMGERLGRVESLIRHGITPITVDAGVRVLCDLLRTRETATALVVSGRFGERPTLKLARPDLPFQRFLERRRVHYPGVELIVDAELSPAADPYLDDHVMQKQRLLPAVLGLEAMAQTAMALAGSDEAPVFENVELPRPIGVSEQGITIRLAALQRDAGRVEVCVRSEATDFQVDHFRAVCRFGTVDAPPGMRPAASAAAQPDPALDPGRDLYGRILFHQGRFRRLRGYRLLKAKECVAEIGPDDGAAWFGPYLPGAFVLGDPAARDAALHSIQACIPHLRILPTGMDRLVVLRRETGARLVHARERNRDGPNFVFDVEITSLAGEVVEQWDGLRLRGVEAIAAREAWPEPLLAPYWERRLEELLPGSLIRVALERGWREERPASTDAVIQQALGRTERVWRRPDGKPAYLGKEGVSAAHCDQLTLAVAASGETACDLETAAARPEAAWRDLLGAEALSLARQIAQERPETLDIAATRLWSARECLKKAGRPPDAPLTMDFTTADGWVLLRSGTLAVATCAVVARGKADPLVMAIALPAGPSMAAAQEAAVA